MTRSQFFAACGALIAAKFVPNHKPKPHNGMNLVAIVKGRQLNFILDQQKTRL